MASPLRGVWRLERGEWALAVASLNEAVAMAQTVGQRDVASETRLVLAKLHLGQLAPWLSCWANTTGSRTVTLPVNNLSALVNDFRCNPTQLTPKSRRLIAFSGRVGRA